ncbi:glycosyltransferase family 2 protein [Allorhizobium taibaishanense]|uniref:chitin synthase n=1 Tax=Allorhizobium taibaishanense TaxID=887144 RepID=A0A7W6HKI4_9HYPH|nr:glycosyltransferase [Allorhizobium taibaishanense]MBB4006601.1 chitin synthase [Allorhizobium taibaishanense]
MTFHSPVARDGAAGRGAAMAVSVLPHAKLPSHHHSAIWLDEQPVGNADLLVCLTLYNEPPDALEDTLACLTANQARLPGRDAGGTSLEVVIVLDGRDRVHPQTEALINRLGFDLDRDCGLDDAHKVNSLDILSDRVRVQTRQIAAQEFAKEAWLDDPGQDLPPLVVHLAVKERNRGKLDSHALFFRGIVPCRNPDFVLQIDAGSRPVADCLVHLLERMRREPDCAALATNVMMEGVALTDWLQSWQQADFLWQKISDWPIGHGLGYLEVVPGQASLMRMSALQRSPAGDPLDAYLRGLSRPDGLLEANLFLAEDRIIGAEIVKSHGSATIRYERDATILTDGCKTVGELLRQRRRWTNSTLSARLAVVASLGQVICRSPAGPGSGLETRPGRRVSLSLAVLWALWQNLEQWFIPSTLALLVSLSTGFLQDEIRSVMGVPLAPVMAAGVLLFWLYCMVSMTGRDAKGAGRGSMQTLLHGIGIATLLALALPGLFTSLAHAASGSLAVFSASIFVLGLAVWRHSSNRLPDLVRLFLFYIPTSLVVSFYMLTYAFANIHDVSWGTKGLVAATGPAYPPAWLRMRRQFLAVWVVSNAAMVTLVLGIIPGGAVTMLQVFSVPFFIRIAIAALLLLREKSGRKQRVFRAGWTGGPVPSAAT